MKTKILIVGVITAILVGITFKLKSNKHIVDANVYKPELNKAVLVKAAPVESIKMERKFNYTGTFLPYREVMLVPQVHGEVKEVFFNEGDLVRKGDLLVQIDDDLLQAQYIAAKANYETTSRNLYRHQNASESGGVSGLQLDKLRLDVTTAESQMKQLAKQIQLSRIVAPFTGTITFRDVERGSVVGSQPVARITDLTKLKLELSVPENEIVYFNEGEQSEIETSVYPGKLITGEIELVSEQGDNAHNYGVRILVQNDRTSTPLKAGMYGTALLSKTTDGKALVIPRAALLGSAKNPQVYVISNKRAVLTDIQTGVTMEESIQVIEGLHDGDSVVATGHINLSSGSLVKLVNSDVE